MSIRGPITLTLSEDDRRIITRALSEEIFRLTSASSGRVLTRSEVEKLPEGRLVNIVKLESIRDIITNTL